MEVNYSNFKSIETATLEQGGITVQAECTVKNNQLMSVSGNMRHADGRYVFFGNDYGDHPSLNMNGPFTLVKEGIALLFEFISAIEAKYNVVSEVEEAQ